MSNLLDLQVVAGNQAAFDVTSDTAANSAVCSIVDVNLNEVNSLVSVLAGNGLDLVVTLEPVDTLRARRVGTMLQIAWNFGAGRIENTRVNLVGVPA